MKIVLAQQNYHIGNFELNTSKIIDAIRQAKAQKADLVVFSELSVCGYPPLDLLEFADFINKSYEAVERIAAYADDIGVLLGAPAKNKVSEGKDLYNAAYFLHEKQVKAQVYKTLLPTYDVFDEYRYFEPASDWKVVEFKGMKLAVTICEDIWNLVDNPMYRYNPMDQLILQRPDLMINLSASPFDYTHANDRREICRNNVIKYGLPLIYCNAVGGQTELVFDGGSLVFDKTGKLCRELPQFEESIFSVEVNGSDIISSACDPGPSAQVLVEPERFEPELNIAMVHRALLTGIRDYFRKMGFEKAIVGSSGGIDSAVTISLACEALGKENVRAVMMPSPYSTSHSVDDAVALSRNLGNPYDVIRIDEIYQSFLETLEPVFGDLPFSVAEENIQSRARGNLLMAIANKFGYVLLNTSNKSELATGYGTLYGDMAGGLAVLGDCYKQQVYALARYINREKEIIPRQIIDKAPSAELRPNQKDSDSLPEYHVLDQVLFQYIEKRSGPEAIKQLGFDGPVVDRVLKLVNTNEYKRNQFCPIIRVSPKAFGVGRRIPIVAKYLN
ncbi:MAG TPA: NAD+ synthase [Chitinophagaceae bacterium]